MQTRHLTFFLAAALIHRIHNARQILFFPTGGRVPRLGHADPEATTLRIRGWSPLAVHLEG